MHSLKAICDALATALRTTSTPTGANPLRAAYAQAPKSTPATPCVFVIPDTGTVVLEAGAWSVTHHINVHFLAAKRASDPARVETDRQLWLRPLLSQVITTGYTLGLVASGLKSALPMTYEWQEYEVGGEAYDGIVIHFDAIVREPIVVAA